MWFTESHTVSVIFLIVLFTHFTNKFKHCKGIRNNTGSRQTTGIQEELDSTCKQNASRQTTQDNETLFPNWQKESWQTSEETSGYVRLERVNKWPNSMTDI